VPFSLLTCIKVEKT